MDNNGNTSVAATLQDRVKAFLDAKQNKLSWDLTDNPIVFKQHGGNLFSSTQDLNLSLSFGFQGEHMTENTTPDQFRSNFAHFAINCLPLPGLDDIPSNWTIYPQTPMSAFSDGITLEDYDPNTQILKIHIQTKFFAIYGNDNSIQLMADAPAPEGSYFQLRQNAQGDIKLHAKLDFD